MANILIGKVVGSVASGIGLVSEGISAKKKSSATMREEAADGNILNNAYLPSQPQGQAEAIEEHDEEQWDLDEAQESLVLPVSVSASYNETARAVHNVHNFTTAFLAKYPVPSHMSEAGQLELPVVLPQRRPGGRHRGFVRAYAPVLEAKGIDQATFLDFIDTFDRASQASPLIQAINLAGFAAIPLAPPFSILVSVALKVAADAAAELHARSRTHSFLDRANNEFFRPRGLFCLVMTWNPESGEHTNTIDIASRISSRIGSSSSAAQKLRGRFKPSDGKTYGELDFPEVAPLIYPALDELANQPGEEAASKRAKLKKAKNFSSEYLDRRAVAKYAGENPDSVLTTQAGPKPTFTSRYADPNHPAASGNLISLVTGGHVNPPSLSGGGVGFGGLGGGLGRGISGGSGGLGGGLGRGRGLENSGVGMLIGGLVDRRNRSSSRSREGGRQNLQQGSVQQREGGLGRGAGLGGVNNPISALNPISGIKRVLKQGVLYLMIVDMPSEEELAASAQTFEQAR